MLYGKQWEFELVRTHRSIAGWFPHPLWLSIHSLQWGSHPPIHKGIQKSSASLGASPHTCSSWINQLNLENQVLLIMLWLTFQFCWMLSSMTLWSAHKRFGYCRFCPQMCVRLSLRIVGVIPELWRLPEEGWTCCPSCSCPSLLNKAKPTGSETFDHALSLLWS